MSLIPKWFLNSDIEKRLAWSFVCVVGLMIAFGAIALYEMNGLAKQTTLLFEHPFAVTDAVDEVELQIVKIHREMKDLAHSKDAAEILAHEEQIQKLETEALKHLALIKERFLGDPAQVQAVEDHLLAWQPIRQRIIDLRMLEDYTAADAVARNESARHIILLQGELEYLHQFAAKKAAEALARTHELKQRGYWLLSSLLIGASLLGAAIAYAIIYSIRRPLSDLGGAAQRISQGDLDQNVPIHSEDELGRLSRVFNSMVGSIRRQTEEINQKNKENETLLLNILPGPIADRLRQGEETIADHFPEVTVLFADIAGFSEMSILQSPSETVASLNALFSAFDEIAQQHKIEKIKTIGDAYMAASGLNQNFENNTRVMVDMALNLFKAVERINAQQGTSLDLRIGINVGPVVAGVIGQTKFIYDLWGDTVNLASRMESHGVVGRIQLSAAAYEKVKDHYAIEERGLVPVKGMGELPTYLVAA